MCAKKETDNDENTSYPRREKNTREHYPCFEGLTTRQAYIFMLDEKVELALIYDSVLHVLHVRHALSLPGKIK